MSREYSPWHTLTVHAYEWTSLVDEGLLTYVNEVDIDHPAECDQLKYGEQCWFDRDFYEITDESELPTEPGVYRARVWGDGPDHNGEYDAGSEWEPMPEAAQS